MVSATLSQGSILGCCLKSVNQEHPAVPNTLATRKEKQIPRFARDDRGVVRDDIARFARDVSDLKSRALTAHAPAPPLTTRHSLLATRLALTAHLPGSVA